MKILVVDDEKLVVKGIKFNLEHDGYEVVTAFDGESAVALTSSEKPDLVILDLMMPKLDGLEACMQIRAFSNVPIIMLTARSTDMDKLMGFECGADDYVTKPFSPAELTARIDALYRRIGGDGGADTELLTQGPFVMNIRNRTLEKQGERIRLTQVEFSILKLFMQNPGRALSREDILAAVWGPDYEGELKIVDVNIRRLRIKIEDNATTPKYITTVWGFGYKWGA